VGTESLSFDARRACIDHVIRAMRRSSLLGLPASALLVTILGDAVPLTERLVFVGLVWVADLLAFFACGAYLHRRARGDTVERFWLGPVCIAFIGFAWSSLCVFGLPGPGHSDLRAVYLIFVCGTSATYVVAAAAQRLYFYASQIAMIVPITIAYTSSPDRTTRLLGFATPIYFAVMAVLHREVHGVVTSELDLRQKHDAANAQLRTANDKLATRALTDDLTGLANRAAFVEDLARAVAQAARSGNRIGIVCIDIDWFKVVNDSLGHANGDDLLIQVSNRMQSGTRACDRLARYGGDEFTMLCTDLKAHEEAVVIAKRVAQSLVEPFRIDGRSLNISASIGVATNMHQGDNADALLSHADAALYQAKQHGRNRVEVFDRELQEDFFRRLQDEDELRAALDGDQIVAWYQPIIALETGAISSAEALARWVHPTRGVLDAYKFVPTAEDVGMVLRVDDTIARQVLTSCAALPAELLGPQFRIWVNISAKQFTRAHPTERLAQFFDHVGCDPRMIGIELTETAVLQDLDAAATEIRAARDLGVKVALDDFGAGHSSLTLLRALPIDKVKIDRGFIANIDDSDTDRAIVASVLSLASTLGLEVVAEGVETPEQARLLREMGCLFGQGWLWAKPLPLPSLIEFLRTTNAATTR
jgi:diguanylate cyclase (GGDEF)-like protein